jgi:hypothetical protein
MIEGNPEAVVSRNNGRKRRLITGCLAGAIQRIADSYD